ncbi:hypothetical protein ES703_36955 [subsurface metagenome]
MGIASETFEILRICGGNKSSSLKTLTLSIANMLGELSESDKVEILKEKVGDWSIEDGQYRFNINGKMIYALWGNGSLPPEINGEVKVTEISGVSRVIDSATLKLSDSQIFVEID